MEATSEVRGYHELRIEVESRPDGLFSATMRSSVDECKIDFPLPYPQDRMDQIVGAVWTAYDQRPARRGSLGGLDPFADLGKTLYTALFSGQGEALLRRSQDYAGAAGFGLRLQFSLCDEAAEAVPWEFLYDGRDYLALSTRSPLVSCLASGQGPLPEPSSRFRILAAVADQEFSKGRWKEMTRALYADLQKQFGHLDVNLSVDVTLSQLESELAKGPYDIVHLCGHADRPTPDTRALFLRDEKGQPVPVLPERLAGALARAGAVRLLCVDACNSDLVAADLARLTRIPAVYGIQNMISNESADSFIRNFLAALLSGQTLAVAATQGRQAIDRDRPGSREWALPVLYTNRADGQLAPTPWQASYNVDASGASKGTGKNPTEPVASTPGKASREHQKLETWLTLKRKNLEALQQQLAGSSYAPPEVQTQLANLQAEVASLEAQLAQTP
jgi:hypothetical protein